MNGEPATARAPRPWPGALDWGGDWVADARSELARLGFVLRDGGHPGQIPGPRLLFALRPAPTEEHFDPEEVVYWASGGGRGERRRLERDRGPATADVPFAWGRILVADRIPVTNQFLSFGGRLLTETLPDGTRIAAFVSRAPIGRWSGHSQGTDPLTDDLGAFFARLKVPILYQPGAEARVAAALPEVLYAAFLEHSSRRLRAAARLRASEPGFSGAVTRERARLSEEMPEAWREGVALLDWLELA